MNKERFHNALALSLGYERIIKDKRITIDVDDSKDPWVTQKPQGSPEVVRFKASDETVVENTPAMQNEINYIADAVHQAYLQTTSKPFCFFSSSLRQATIAYHLAVTEYNHHSSSTNVYSSHTIIKKLSTNVNSFRR